MSEVLEPAFLRGLESLTLARRRSPREGSGRTRGFQHRSSGLDWVGHRPYEPGDDLRYLDHHVWSRIGKPYVRTFHSERSQRVDILIDASRSMSLGRPAKSEVAKALAFVFAYIAHTAGERVGAFPFAENLRGGYQAVKGFGGMARMIAFLENIGIDGRTSVAASMKRYLDEAREIGRVVFLSDCLDDDYESGLVYLHRHGFDVMVVRLRASCDQEPVLSGDHVTVVDIESGLRRPVPVTRAGMEAYRRDRESELEAAKATCRRMRIPFIHLTTGRSLKDLVFGDLRNAGFLE